MRQLYDSIFAPITGTHRAAVCVVRLSGNDAVKIAQKVFQPWPIGLKFRHSYYGDFVHGDDGLMVAFANEASFTGEETVEFHIHGSLASLKGLSELLLSFGARPAEPGEFSQRAMANGRLDLSQAEGIADTIDARSSSQLMNAGRLRSGELRKFCTEVRESILTALAHIEAHVDFSEELGELDRPELSKEIAQAINELKPYLQQAKRAKELREGVLVAIVGTPNSGKSSLLNRLSQTDRAIVTPIPGTTRDTLEVTIELNGILFRLIDTAGIRETQEDIEALGIERSRQAIEDAQICMLVYDAQTGFGPEQEQILSSIPQNRPIIVIGNKVDLTPNMHGIGVSCLKNIGIEELQNVLVESSEMESNSEVLTVNLRQLQHLNDCYTHLNLAVDALNSPIPDDLISTLLRSAEQSLGQVSGQTATPNMVDEIFSRFCLGK